ncbi:sugar fermentation stimulation protein A [Thermosipho atlanticus DSM 15807]|uniref:Sugar fermentation stimulation protein homolog n=2 Tax=Thermosipho TaxID=2420 RepID=A0A1M5SPA0_9BACT|nr:sugar fermentation stimulation protein A [Thermosipho atlanticus DSM 15807]
MYNKNMKKLLKIPFTDKAIFLKRLNKYVGLVKLNNETTTIHIHDPGRLTELIFPGNEVLINRVNNPKRKTHFDLIAAKNDNEWILVNSMYHSKIAEKIIKYNLLFSDKIELIKSEVKFKNSRFDFLVKTCKTTTLIEVKGCTLRKENIALFPDAPTKRGNKHLLELIEAQKLGFKGILVILVFPQSKCFAPNFDTDKTFSQNFIKSLNHYINIFPIQLKYSPQFSNNNFQRNSSTMSKY